MNVRLCGTEETPRRALIADDEERWSLLGLPAASDGMARLLTLFRSDRDLVATMGVQNTHTLCVSAGGGYIVTAPRLIAGSKAWRTHRSKARASGCRLRLTGL